MTKQSKRGVSSWIPSKESKSYAITLSNSAKPALVVEYTPEPIIEELNKLFTFLYLKGIGLEVPPNLLVRSDSPLSGLLTAWYAMGAYITETDSVKRRRAATAEEVENMLEEMGSATTAEVKSKAEEFRKMQSDPTEISKMAFGVGRWTTLAADYVAEHLSEKIQSALIELIMEAEIHAFYVGAEERGLKPVNTKYEQNIVDTIVRGEEKMIKLRLKTRRPGGSKSPHDFSQLDEFYEQGKELFIKARKTLNTLNDLPRESQHAVLIKAYPEIDADLISRMLGGEAYLSTRSHLAAEWAGRRCGLPADRPEKDYPTTYLLQILSRKKKK